MRYCPIILACILIGVSPANGVFLRVENGSGATGSLVGPGEFTLSLSIIAVTEEGDVLDGFGWFGGSGVDITHAVSGSATADIDPADVTVPVEVWPDDVSSFPGDDNEDGVENLIFATNLDIPGPGSNPDDRVVIARVNVRVTNAQNGDVITISVADVRPPAEAYASASADLAAVSISSRTPHTATVTSHEQADFDEDGDIDLADFMELSRCFTGPGVPAAPDCLAADLDGDGDVDLADAVALQAAFTGSR